MNESLQLELIRDEQISGVVRSISLAIQVDPFVVAMTPDEQRRASFVKWLIPRLVGYGQRWGNVFCPEDGSGGAIWLAPGNTTMGFTQMARGGLLAMPLKVGLRGIPRLLRTMSITEGFHTKMEVLQRHAYGFRNFQNYGLRVKVM